MPLIEDEWAKAGFEPNRTTEELLSTIDLLKPRARSLKDFAGAFKAYFSDEFEFDSAAVAKFFKDDDLPLLLAELGIEV